MLSLAYSAMRNYICAYEKYSTDRYSRIRISDLWNPWIRFLTIAVMIISVDSRSVTRPSETVFYALRGQNNDGHDYVAGLYSRGVRHFVLSERRPEFEHLDGASVVYVPDTLAELQKDAERHRRECRAEVTAITGSNGKTIVKEWIAQLIGEDVPVCRSPRSYNSQVGVPLSVLEITDDCRIALIEAGMSRKGEMAKLQRIIAPDLGIFTHLGDAHGENFSSMEEKMREKAILFKDCRTVICREGYAADIIAGQCGSGTSMYLWGSSDSADVRVLSSKAADSGRDVELSVRRTSGQYEKGNIHIPFADEASFENCMNAVAFMLYHGYTLETVAGRVPGLQPVAMRMEIREGTGGSTLIKDYYNSDPASFALALDALAVQDNTRPKAVILSDFVDVGGRAKSIYGDVAVQLKKAGVTRFVGVGPCLSEYRELFDLPQTKFYNTTEEFLAGEKRSDYRNMGILIKGARKYRFEYIGGFLAKQSHTTVLEVDLDALANNFNILRNRVPKGTALAVMVKAFSYGSGAGEVAAQLQYSGASYMMVAYADEGVTLRMKGITVPIGVMNPEPEAFDQMIEFSLEPEIYSLRLLKDFEAVLARDGIEDYPVHLKLNTGMNRSGLDLQDIPELLEFLKGRKTVMLRSMFSHLAAADDPSEDKFTLGQIALFEKMTGMIQPHFPYRILRHILNTAGIERFPQYAFDMVRMGIGLYGVGTVPGLVPVSSFKTHIASVRTITPDQTVGYGRKGRVDRVSRIAVIPVGYADGLDRHLSCGVGQMLVRGKRVPIIGNICMDACMLDVTDTDAEVGDEVEIFGRNIPVTELSDKLGTIPYEVLTSVSGRVKRVYFKE